MVPSFRCYQKAIFQSKYLTDLFENIKVDDILSFLRETGLYQKYDNLKLVNLVQTMKSAKRKFYLPKYSF